MAKLFKRPYWIMLGVLFIALIGAAATAIIAPNSPFILFFLIAITIDLLISQIPREKHIYNEVERENELSQIRIGHEQYVSDVWSILKEHGIDTHDKVLNIKAECVTTMKMRKGKYEKIFDRIIDMLIGVPLGTLVASIIYADSTVVPMAIGAVIIVGLAVLGLLKIINLINYYSDGYFKDKYLLDALNELDYFDEALNSCANTRGDYGKVKI